MAIDITQPSVLLSLHAAILAVVGALVAVLALKQQDPFKTHYATMVVFLVGVFIYVVTVVLSINLQGVAQKVTISVSLSFGLLGFLLLILIMVPPLGWACLALWAVSSVLIIAYELQYCWRPAPPQPDTLSPDHISIQMSPLADGQRARPTRKGIRLVNRRDPKRNQTWDYDVKDRTRLSQMIARCKAEGLLIDSVESFFNMWDLIMDDATGFSEQVYMLSPHFLPDNWIEEQRGNGFYITAIAGDNDGSSLVVMSRGTQFHDKQLYKVCESIPYKWMERKVKKGYSVTAEATTGKKWAIVMSKGAGFSKQQVVEVDSNYPSERIHKRSDSGCDTTAMAETTDPVAFVRSEPSTMMIRPR